MASVILRISKKLPQEELLEILKTVSPSVDISSSSSDLKCSISDVITCLPDLLNGSQQELWERFTLIGYLFSEFPEFLTLISALEEFSQSLPALTSLAFLYDLVQEPYQKFKIFKAIYKQASRESTNLSLIQPHLLKIEEFIKLWTVDPQELHEFIIEILNLSISSLTKSRLIFKLLAENTLNQEIVDKLLRIYLNTSETYDFERILLFNSFNNASEEVKQLIQLLNNASAPEVIKFLHENEIRLNQKGFDCDKILDICRVSGLAKIMTGASKIDFQQISQRLSITEDEVDYWVVRAVSGGLIKVKIDAINKVVNIEQSRLLSDKKSALELLNRFEQALNS